MKLATTQAYQGLSNKYLPANSQSRFRAYSYMMFLHGDSYNEHFLPADADIAEFRSALLELIDNKLSIARNIKFYALCMLTVNHVLKLLPAMQNLYAEILASDPKLVELYDDSYLSLVILASINDRPHLLKILKQFNAPMPDYIPIQVDLGDDPTSVFQLAEVGESAAKAYLRRLTPRGPFTFPFDMNNATQSIAILLGDYSPEQMQAFEDFAKTIDNTELATQVLNAAKELIEEQKIQQRMLTFLSPRIIKSRNGAPNAPQLQTLFNGTGDSAILMNIYSFTRRPRPAAL
jgi:hypothetical protein